MRRRTATRCCSRSRRCCCSSTTRPDLTFDPIGSLAPVSELARTPSAIAVNAKSGIGSFKELVAHCNKAAKPCSWGTGQQLSYLYGRRAFAISGIRETVNVPYKGTGPVVTDLLGGHIDIGDHEHRGTAAAPPERLAAHPGGQRRQALGAGARRAHLPRSRPERAGARIVVRTIRAAQHAGRGGGAHRAD